MSVSLGPQHLQQGRIPHTFGRPAALVLEFEDQQWVMYYLNADKKIQMAWAAASLDDALARAQYEFEIKPEEWIESYSH
ncbi:MAG: hypothetical protein JO128_09615 [Alphaproteobacteria bacterium]|nr:hypothetical protein [Alphaproteobacteria bacterium]